jgi:hypothetical protein
MLKNNKFKVHGTCQVHNQIFTLHTTDSLESAIEAFNRLSADNGKSYPDLYVELTAVWVEYDNMSYKDMEDLYDVVVLSVYSDDYYYGVGDNE